MIQPVDSGGIDFSRIVSTWELGSELTFTFRAPPGHMRIVPSSLPQGWGLKTIRYHGVDVTETGIEFKAGEEVPDIEVELTHRLTQVSGMVRNAKKEIADDCTVLLFARDRDRRRGTSRDFAMARPDQTGKFTASGLAAGDYYAIALEYVDVNEAQNPDLLEGLVKDAVPFTLLEAEAKVLDLQLAVTR
jgi:hypothetical protein